MILVDTNVVLDVVTNDPKWSRWSQEQLDMYVAHDRVAINDVVYAELSVGFLRIEELDAMIAATKLDLIGIPRSALFLAGKAFQSYRLNRGTKTGVLPDFFIGAHAAVEGMALLTRDAARYRTYFPTLDLLAPGLE